MIAHFHYTFVPIAIIAVFAGITFWFPKMFGRMLNETLGKIHFWGTVIPFNVIFIPLFITGVAGDQRRVYSYAQFAEQSRPALQHLRTTSTIALLVMLSFQLVFLFNFFWSLRNGKTRRERIRGGPRRSSGRCPRRLRTEILPNCRLCIAAPTNMACRAARKITGRRTFPIRFAVFGDRDS